MHQTTLLTELLDQVHVQNFGNDGREVFDFYPTDPRLVHPLFQWIDFPPLIFEPMSGASAIADVFRGAGVDVFESDIRWDMKGAPKDATTTEFWQYYARWLPEIMLEGENKGNWGTVTNPAFDVAPEFMRLAFDYSPWGVVALLRLSFIEPCKDRREWLLEHIDHLRLYVPINPRHVFKPGGNDSVTCAWYWFDPCWSWKRLGIQCPFQYIHSWK